MLHIVLAGPGSASFRRALGMAASGDAMVLAGEAVTAGTHPGTAEVLRDLAGATIGVLQRDLEDRGLRRHLLLDEALLLDDATLVEWMARYPQLRSWT